MKGVSTYDGRIHNSLFSDTPSEERIIRPKKGAGFGNRNKSTLDKKIT